MIKFSQAASANSTPITQGVAGWGGRYGIRQLGLQVVRGRRGYIILFADPQGMPELQEARPASTLTTLASTYFGN